MLIGSGADENEISRLYLDFSPKYLQRDFSLWKGRGTRGQENHPLIF
jgi:hypothetical protein